MQLKGVVQFPFRQKPTDSMATAVTMQSRFHFKLNIEPWTGTIYLSEKNDKNRYIRAWCMGPIDHLNKDENKEYGAFRITFVDQVGC